jgi:hypothetical protein
MFFKIYLGVLGIVKKLIYSSKLAVESIFIALAIYSRLIERL